MGWKNFKAALVVFRRFSHAALSLLDQAHSELTVCSSDASGIRIEGQQEVMGRVGKFTKLGIAETNEISPYGQVWLPTPHQGHPQVDALVVATIL